MTVACRRKGWSAGIKVVKGGQYECCSCGTRWPMKDGSSHP